MNIQTHHELKCREKPVAIFFSFVFFLLFQKRRTHKNKTIITYESNNEIGEAPTATTKKFSLIFSCSFWTFFVPHPHRFFSLHNFFYWKKNLVVVLLRWKIVAECGKCRGRLNLKKRKEYRRLKAIDHVPPRFYSNFFCCAPFESSLSFFWLLFWNRNRDEVLWFSLIFLLFFSISIPHEAAGDDAIERDHDEETRFRRFRLCVCVCVCVCVCSMLKMGNWCEICVSWRER